VIGAAATNFGAGEAFRAVAVAVALIPCGAGTRSGKIIQADLASGDGPGTDAPRRAGKRNALDVVARLLIVAAWIIPGRRLLHPEPSHPETGRAQTEESEQAAAGTTRGRNNGKLVKVPGIHQGSSCIHTANRVGIGDQ
jgi:hypothetical protein